MFEENPFPNQSEYWKRERESNEERIARIRRKKNIRKQKVESMRMRKMFELSKQEKEDDGKKKLSLAQKKEKQRLKNRKAAQVSREKQRVFIESLEKKIDDLEGLVRNQLCRKCSSHLYSTENESNDEGNSKQSYLQNNFELIEQPELTPLPLMRSTCQKSELQLGKFGSFFCFVMLILSVACFVSVDDEGSNVIGKGRIMLEMRRLPPAAIISKNLNPNLLKFLLQNDDPFTKFSHNCGINFGDPDHEEPDGLLKSSKTIIDLSPKRGIKLSKNIWRESSPCGEYQLKEEQLSSLYLSQLNSSSIEEN